MPCFEPISAHSTIVPMKPNGKNTIFFNYSGSGQNIQPLDLPCGQCTGCRIERSRQWAVRCMHEASLHKENCFLTLTLDDDHLPDDLSLNVRTFQLFMKKLRKQFKNQTIRFYHCGEYGEKYGRPHYHALLFNFNFPDKIYSETSPSGERLYKSAILDRLWSNGRARIGTVTFNSAAYVSRYIMKKQNISEKSTNAAISNYYDRYEYINPKTGQIVWRKPEYNTMSRRPGIGAGWYQKYKTDVYPHDFVVLRDGKKIRPPKFYDRQYEMEYPTDFLDLKNKRVEEAKKHIDNNTPDRLKVRNEIFMSKISKLQRGNAETKGSPNV